MSLLSYYNPQYIINLFKYGFIEYHYDTQIDNSSYPLTISSDSSKDFFIKLSKYDLSKTYRDTINNTWCHKHAKRNFTWDYYRNFKSDDVRNNLLFTNRPHHFELIILDLLGKIGTSTTNSEKNKDLPEGIKNMIIKPYFHMDMTKKDLLSMLKINHRKKYTVMDRIYHRLCPPLTSQYQLYSTLKQDFEQTDVNAKLGVVNSSEYISVIGFENITNGKSLETFIHDTLNCQLTTIQYIDILSVIFQVYYALDHLTTCIPSFKHNNMTLKNILVEYDTWNLLSTVIPSTINLLHPRACYDNSNDNRTDDSSRRKHTTLFNVKNHKLKFTNFDKAYIRDNRFPNIFNMSLLHTNLEAECDNIVEPYLKDLDSNLDIFYFIIELYGCFLPIMLKELGLTEEMLNKLPNSAEIIRTYLLALKEQVHLPLIINKYRFVTSHVPKTKKNVVAYILHKLHHILDMNMGLLIFLKYKTADSYFTHGQYTCNSVTTLSHSLKTIQTVYNNLKDDRDLRTIIPIYAKSHKKFMVDDDSGLSIFQSELGDELYEKVFENLL
jgi:hypothetical protein